MTAPEQLYYNGNIITVDPRQTEVEAVAVSGGKIAAIGDISSCRSRLGSTPEKIDLKGKTMLPGFIDCHMHPTLMIFHELFTEFTNLDSLQALQNKIRETKTSLTASDWIVGLQFEEQYFVNPVKPTRHDLDKACSDQPVVLLKRDGHSLFANTKAIQTAGIDANTSEPEGGMIERESDGYPSGAFKENAMELILSALPLPDTQRIIDAVSTIFSNVTRHGITSAGVILQTDDEGVLGERGAFDLPLMEMVIDQIPISLYSFLVTTDVQKIVEAQKGPLHNPELGKGHRIGGSKFWADGSFSSCTAKMIEPFSDAADTTGLMVQSNDEIYKRMVDAHTAGLQLAVHSIGDESTRIVMEQFDRLFKKYPRKNHRHRVEHVSVMNKELVEEFARLKLIASVQPMFIYSEKNWLEKRLGSERLKWTYPFKSFLDAGIVTAASSDAPIEPLDVMQAIQSCVTREGMVTEQSISLMDAIKLFTVNAAYSQFEETVKGSISEGKRADFSILSANPFKVSENEIKDIQVEKTICGGKIV